MHFQDIMFLVLLQQLKLLVQQELTNLALVNHLALTLLLVTMLILLLPQLKQLVLQVHTTLILPRAVLLHAQMHRLVTT